MRTSILGTVCLIGCGGQVQRAEPRVSSPAAAAPAKIAGPGVAPSQPSAAIEPRDPDERTIVELRRARGLFTTFIDKAGTKPEYADAVKRSRDRIEDLDATIAFLEQGLRERRGAP